jgi:hypothetical protein
MSRGSSLRRGVCSISSYASWPCPMCPIPCPPQPHIVNPPFQTGSSDDCGVGTLRQDSADTRSQARFSAPSTGKISLGASHLPSWASPMQLHTGPTISGCRGASSAMASLAENSMYFIASTCSSMIYGPSPLCAALDRT